MCDKHQVTEEPCEFKGSCTVLKSNGSCERVVDFNRSCHDAIRHIQTAIQQKAKYVLDADIAKCFDRINHIALLQKLNHRGKISNRQFPNQGKKSIRLY